MSRHRRINSPENDEPGLDISSLIDVCFLLLIYFIVTTQIVKKEQELSTGLPGHELEGVPPEIAPLMIHLEANGRVFIQNETDDIELIESDPDSRELPDLARRLKLHKNASLISGSQALVQIKVNDDALQQRVTDVLNALAGAKIRDITFVDLLPPAS